MGSYLVVAASQFGFLAYRIAIAAGSMRLKFDIDGRSAMTFMYVSDPSKWKVAEVKVEVREASAADTAAGARFSILFGANSARLLKFSGRKGFLGLSTAHLNKLFDELKVVCYEGAKPSSEAQLVTALLAHVFGEENAAPGFIKSALLAWHETAALPAQLTGKTSFSKRLARR